MSYADERFAELRTLTENWDSYGGRPLQPDIEARARKILDDLRGEPLICMHPDGGVDLEWSDEAICIEVRPLDGLGVVFGDRELVTDEDRKLECPASMCAASYVGPGAERKLVDHYCEAHLYWAAYREESR